MRGILRVAVISAAVAVAAAGVTSALAAGSPGWHTVQEFGASYGSPELTGGIAVSADSAWVQGYTYQTGSSLFLAHWNGSHWAQVAGPAALSTTSGSVSPGPMAASGASLWSFPTVWATKNRVYAARLTGGHWTTWPLPGALLIDGAAVFGNSDVWAFGEALLPPGWPGLRNGPAYAEHFNGHRWRQVQVPGVPLIVQALNPSDIWAYGPTNRTASSASQKFIAMHWNGRKWSTLPIPRMHAANGKLMWPGGFAVLKDDSLWVTEGFHCRNPACRPPQRAGMILARWNGRKWVRVLDKKAYGDAFPVPDGRGGLWINVVTTKNPQQAYLHYTHGRVTVTIPPRTAAGSSANVSSPFPIPGTTSAWSTGDLDLGAGETVAAVFTYHA